MLNKNNTITILKYTKLKESKDFIVVNEGKILSFYFINISKINQLINDLKILVNKNIIKILKQNEIDKNFYFKLDDRLPDLFIIASPGYCLRIRFDSNVSLL